jgi:hypothetical protein
VSYRGFFRYTSDRYGLEGFRQKVGKAFNPEVGYVQRSDIERTDVIARFSPRLRSTPGLRKIGGTVEMDRFVNSRGIEETRVSTADFRIDFDSSDAFTATARQDREFLQVPFRIARGVVIPVGQYDFLDAMLRYTIGPQRMASGQVTLTSGAFYSGHRQQIDYSGRIKVTNQLGFEPRVLLGRITLPQGNFTTRLTGVRTIYTITPRMFLSGLLQYNSSLSTVETNVRWRWEYQPGSDLFVVYTDGRDTTPIRGTSLLNRGIAIKVTRLLRF